MRRAIEQESNQGIKHIQQALPVLSELIESVGPLTYPESPDIPLLDALARVINSQMLSTHAASAILSRIREAVENSGCTLIVDLSDEQLRACGWSASKVKTLRLFAEKYRADPSSFERWRELAFDDLEKQVKACWGISTWTAEMLSIFYFDNRDIFPRFDLAVNKAVAAFTQLDSNFDPDRAKPHRTLLAMYMWASYRENYWDSVKANIEEDNS